MRNLYTSERSLYLMRSLILSQCRDQRMGVIIMRKFRSFNHSRCKTVLNLLEATYLRFRKIVVETNSESCSSQVRTEWTIEAAMVLAVCQC